MLWLWPVTLCDHFCDCYHIFVTLWLATWYFPCSTLVIKEKKRKGKEILNNDLAVLPSHDIKSITSNWYINLVVPRKK